MCAILYNSMVVLISMNLILGTIIALKTLSNLQKNHDRSYDLGKNDYKLWLMMIIISFVLIMIDYFLSSLKVMRCYIIFLPLQPSIIFMMTILLLFSVSLYSWIRICMNLKNLDSSTTYQFDIPNFKKLHSYLLIYLAQWVSFKINATSFNQR